MCTISYRIAFNSITRNRTTDADAGWRWKKYKKFTIESSLPRVFAVINRINFFVLSLSPSLSPSTLVSFTNRVFHNSLGAFQFPNPKSTHRIELPHIMRKGLSIHHKRQPIKQTKKWFHFLPFFRSFIIPHWIRDIDRLIDIRRCNA